MKKCKMTQSNVRQLHWVAASTLAIALTVLPYGVANAQGWPFNDAPKPVTHGVQQTSSLRSTNVSLPPQPGLIMHADELELGQNETVVGGDKILQETGILRSHGNQGGFAGIGSRPVAPLSMSGRSSRRRSRGQRGFGPKYSQECSWDCPGGCAPAVYANFEALYMQQSEDPFSYAASIFNFTGDDYQPAFRITAGYMANCSDGYEVVYAGPLEWEARGTQTDKAFGELNFRIAQPMEEQTVDGVTTLVPSAAGQLLDPFYNADRQYQYNRAKFSSYEANQRTWGWDVISTVIGIRAVQYDQDAIFETWKDNTAGGTEYGRFARDINNFLIGPQMGIDMMYPITRRLMLGTKVRGAVFVNFQKTETLIDATTQAQRIVHSSDDDYDFAGMFETGVFMSYHFMNCLTAKVGYEFWWLGHVTTVASEFEPTYNGSLSGNGQTDDVDFSGATVSLEVLF